MAIKKGLKIGLWITGAVAAITGSFFAFKYFMKPKSETTDTGGIGTTGTGTSGIATQVLPRSRGGTGGTVVGGTSTSTTGTVPRGTSGTGTTGTGTQGTGTGGTGTQIPNLVAQTTSVADSFPYYKVKAYSSIVFEKIKIYIQPNGNIISQVLNGTDIGAVYKDDYDKKNIVDFMKIYKIIVTGNAPVTTTSYDSNGNLVVNTTPDTRKYKANYYGWVKKSDIKTGDIIYIKKR